VDLEREGWRGGGVVFGYSPPLELIPHIR